VDASVTLITTPPPVDASVTLISKIYKHTKNVKHQANTPLTLYENAHKSHSYKQRKNGIHRTKASKKQAKTSKQKQAKASK
jgi:hypothetical protein